MIKQIFEKLIFEKHDVYVVKYWVELLMEIR